MQWHCQSRGSNWGSLGLHTKTNAKQMRSRSQCTVRRFTCVYLHAQIAVDAGDIHTWQLQLFWLRVKPEDPNLSLMSGSKWCRFWDPPCISVKGSHIFLPVVLSLPPFTSLCPSLTSQQCYQSLLMIKIYSKIGLYTRNGVEIPSKSFGQLIETPLEHDTTSNFQTKHTSHTYHMLISQ